MQSRSVLPINLEKGMLLSSATSPNKVGFNPFLQIRAKGSGERQCSQRDKQRRSWKFTSLSNHCPNRSQHRSQDSALLQLMLLQILKCASTKSQRYFITTTSWPWAQVEFSRRFPYHMWIKNLVPGHSLVLMMNVHQNWKFQRNDEQTSKNLNRKKWSFNHSCWPDLLDFMSSKSTFLAKSYELLKRNLIPNRPTSVTYSSPSVIQGNLFFLVWYYYSGRSCIYYIANPRHALLQTSWPNWFQTLKDRIPRARRPIVSKRVMIVLQIIGKYLSIDQGETIYKSVVK